MLGLALGAAVLGGSSAAHAQSADYSTTLIAPIIPQGFDRGRNVSVVEQQRPDYDPIGVPIGSFNAFPRIDIGAGGTSNVYLANNGDEQAAPLIYVNPSIRLNSDWSVHQLTFAGSGQIRRFVGESRRNENAWNLGTLGRLDLGDATSITGEAQLARQYETPFSGEVDSRLTVLSRYLRDFESLRGVYQAGQGRGILAVDHTGFDFDRIPLGDDTYIDQRNRDRDVTRLTGQLEYAFTPSVSIYAQGTLGFTRYDHPLGEGIPNRDSNAYRTIGGVSFDIAGLARGTIGVGYVWRNYLSSLYRNVSGFSIESRIEYFPSELTTFTLALRRVIEDSSISSTEAYFDNRLSLRVDHALLRNFLVNASAEVARQVYIGSPERSDVYRFAGGGRYMVSRVIGIDFGLTYTGRNTHGADLGRNFNEVRGQIGFSVQR